MYELIYTSVTKGIGGGTGYATAAHTKGLPRTLIEALEAVSTFKHIETNPLAFQKNPVSFSHLTIGTGSQRAHVVSRIAACEPDHSGRTNFIAHHIVLTAQEAAALPAGPVAVASQPGLFRNAWHEPAQLLPPRALPQAAEPAGAGTAWRAAGLDPAWADWLAQRLRSGGKATFVIHRRGSDLLPLFGDVFSLLPPAQRWASTFATYSSQVFPGVGHTCALRGVVQDTPFAAGVASRSRADCIDLTNSGPAPKVAAAVVRAPASPSSRSTPSQRRPATASGRHAATLTVDALDPLNAEEFDQPNRAVPTSDPGTPVPESPEFRYAIPIAVAIVAAAAIVVGGWVTWQVTEVARRLAAAPRPDSPRPDPPQPDSPRPDSPRPDPPQPDPPQPDPPKTGSLDSPARQLQTKLANPKGKETSIILAELPGSVPGKPSGTPSAESTLPFKITGTAAPWDLKLAEEYIGKIQVTKESIALSFDPTNPQCSLLRFLTLDFSKLEPELNPKLVGLGSPSEDRVKPRKVASKKDAHSYSLFPEDSQAAKDFLSTFRAVHAFTQHSENKIPIWFAMEDEGDPSFRAYRPDKAKEKAVYNKLLDKPSDWTICFMRFDKEDYTAFVAVRVEQNIFEEDSQADDVVFTPVAYWAMAREDPETLFKWKPAKKRGQSGRPEGTTVARGRGGQNTADSKFDSTAAEGFLAKLKDDLCGEIPPSVAVKILYLPDRDRPPVELDVVKSPPK